MRCKLHRVNSVYTPYIFHELNPNTRLIQGWVLCEGQWCWHGWCDDTEGNILDPIQKIHGIDLTYSVQEPPTEWEKEQSAVDLFDSYQKDQRNFWRNQPKPIQTFRSLCFSKKNN